MNEKSDKQESIYEWMTRMIGPSDRAGRFHPDVKVWSEMAVRAAILRALEDYELKRSNGENFRAEG